MSRIGGAPILIPSGVTVEKTGKTLSVTGPKGALKMDTNEGITVEIEGERITVKRKNNQKKFRALHGLVRSLLANMIKGVTEGFTKDLELVGVGFRAQTDGSKLNLNIGFSHPVEIVAPEGINFEVNENTNIRVLGIDKHLVGQIAANVRATRPPDVYKGKGIRIKGEYIRKKVGKAAKAGAMGAGGK